MWCKVEWCGLMMDLPSDAKESSSVVTSVLILTPVWEQQIYVRVNLSFTEFNRFRIIFFGIRLSIISLVYYITTTYINSCLFKNFIT